MTAYEQIRYEVADGVLTITLDRPDRMNAYTAVMMRELVDAFDRSDADDEVRVVVVTGAGRAFCAGADISRGGSTFDRQTDEAPRDGGGIASLRIYESRKPVIGAINGAAVGFGMTMTLPMDVRMASTGAKFGCVFTRRGIVPEASSTWFLPRLVGHSRAAEWTLTGRVFDAEEALRAGLVSSVHEPEDLLGAAVALAHEIADGTAPVAVSLTRALLWRGLGFETPYAAHVAESRALHVLGAGPDAREGVSAFVEKRTAAFPGRVSTDLPEIFADPQPSWAEELP